jgi:hypothetical protein
MRTLTYEEVEAARNNIIRRRATSRDRNSMLAIVAAVAMAGTGAGAPAAIAVGSLALLYQINFFKTTTKDRQDIGKLESDPSAIAALSPEQSEAIASALIELREQKRPQQQSHATNPPRIGPTNHDAAADRHHPPIPKPTQQPPVAKVSQATLPVVGSGAVHQPAGVDPVEPSAVVDGYAGDPWDDPVEEPGDWFDELFQEPWHCFVYGSTGDGKSTFVCNILHRLTALIPEAQVVIIDPKYPYSEWGGFPVTYKGDRQVAQGVRAMGDETAKRLAHATKEVEAGRPRPEFPPIIYVLDESNTAFTDHGAMVGDNIKRIVSRGRALNVWGIFLGTSCNVSAYGLQVPDLYNCHRFALKSLATVAINRDEALTKTDAARLIQDLKSLQSSPYLALIQSEGRDRQIVHLPPPIDHANQSPPNPENPYATAEQDGGGLPLSAPMDSNPHPGDADQPDSHNVASPVATLIGDVTDEAIRDEFIKGTPYAEVLRSFGIPSDRPEADRIHAIGKDTEREIRAVAQAQSLNATAKYFGTSSGTSKSYQHIRSLWHEENPPPVTAMTGMV